MLALSSSATLATILLGTFFLLQNEHQLNNEAFFISTLCQELLLALLSSLVSCKPPSLANSNVEGPD